MTDSTWNEEDLLSAVRQRNGEAWSYLLNQYQGRLLGYAKSRLHQTSDAEDLVQNAFLSFIKGLRDFRGKCSIETYLFLLLRHELINRSRTRWAKSICLLQEMEVTPNDSQADAMARISDPKASVTRYVQQQEEKEGQYQALAATLKTIIKGFKHKVNFRHLMIIELLFYAGLSSQKAAKLLGISSGNVRTVKHRCLHRLQQGLMSGDPIQEGSFHCSDGLIRDIWETLRLSCPKRSTLGTFMLQELDPSWFEYVDFHLTTLGCHFCRASFKDLQNQQDREQQDVFREKILASTIGFFTR